MPILRSSLARASSYFSKSGLTSVTKATPSQRQAGCEDADVPRAQCRLDLAERKFRQLSGQESRRSAVENRCKQVRHWERWLDVRGHGATGTAGTELVHSNTGAAPVDTARVLDTITSRIGFVQKT